MEESSDLQRSVLEEAAQKKANAAPPDCPARPAGGARAQAPRQSNGERQGREQLARELRIGLPLQPFTLVIEIDAWNIRERDCWGENSRMRAGGEEPSRWHWVYGGACFRLGQRAESAGGRPVIASRGTVMTRGGIDALRE